MRPLALALLVPCLGCNAIFGVAGGHVDTGEIHIQGAPFDFVSDFEVDSGGPTVPSPGVHVDLQHAFALDVDEVTVARFTKWKMAGFPLPKDGASLDPGGPYEDKMRWSSGFDGQANAIALEATDGCVIDDPYDNQKTTTFEIGSGDFPMTCVRWAQAVAFCAYEHKRLPTNAEWQFAAQGGADKDRAPFDTSGTVDCSDAVIDADDHDCGFPKPVGTAKGQSKDGVNDMGGSVAEWTWDATDFDSSIPLPTSEQDDYAGTSNSAMSKHLLRGGEYFTKVPDAVKQNSHGFPGDSSAVSDVGLRCARTILPPN